MHPETMSCCLFSSGVRGALHTEASHGNGNRKICQTATYYRYYVVRYITQGPAVRDLVMSMKLQHGSASSAHRKTEPRFCPLQTTWCQRESPAGSANAVVGQEE